MTHHSPHPADATNDVNTLLDALVSGKRAPEAGSASDLDAFAAVHVHRLVSGDAAADVSARPSEQTLDEIWRNVMQPHAIVPAADNGFVPPQSARQKAQLRAIPERPPVSRFQTLVSMGAIAAMLIVLIGAAWIGRGGSGPVDPEPEHYAAQPLDTGTPTSGWTATAPLSPDAWMQPISWETCMAEPMTSAEYAEIIQSDIDLSGRSYEMVGPPAPEDKAEALTALRNFTACRWVPYGQNDGGMERSLSTDAYLWANANAVSGSEAVEYREASPAFEELEDHFLTLPHSAYEIVLESSAPQEVQDIWEQRTAPAATRNLNVGSMGDELVGGGYPYSISVFDPALSVELEDGRIAFLTTTISWSGDPDIAWLGANPYRSIAVSIMAEEEGEWRFDEEIWLCGEGCQSVEFMPDMMVGDDGAVLENEPRTRSRGANPLQAHAPLMIISTGIQPDTVAADERMVFVQTVDGRLGWVRQVDIVPYVPYASPVATPES